MGLPHKQVRLCLCGDRVYGKEKHHNSVLHCSMFPQTFVYARILQEVDPGHLCMLCCIIQSNVPADGR